MTYAPTPDEICRDALKATSVTRLATLVLERRGFGNSDVGSGVNYPDDLDAFDRAQGHSIPEGFVEVYLGWGAPDGFEAQLPESRYLEIVATVLDEADLPAEAARVRRSLG